MWFSNSQSHLYSKVQSQGLRSSLPDSISSVLNQYTVLYVRKGIMWIFYKVRLFLKNSVLDSKSIKEQSLMVNKVLPIRSLDKSALMNIAQQAGLVSHT